MYDAGPKGGLTLAAALFHQSPYRMRTCVTITVHRLCP
jgi:hypothetical protein